MRKLMMASVAMLAATGCGEGTGGTGPAANERVIAEVWARVGDGQRGTVGQPLPQPVVLRALDADRRPLAGQTLTFAVLGGNGRVCAGTTPPEGACESSAVTDAEGDVRVVWTLGTAVAVQSYGVQQFVVRTADGRQVAVVQAAGVADSPASLSADTYPPRAGVAGTPIGALKVRVTDRYGNPAGDSSVVKWAVAAGGGTITASRSTFDAGVYRVDWTLGTEAVATQTVTATVDGLPAVRFDARAATAMRVAAGDGRSTTAGDGIDAAVELLAGDGSPVGGIVVKWSAPLGAVSATETRSDTTGAAIGRAVVRWTIGGAPGRQTLSATAGPLTAVLSATVRAPDEVGRTPVASMPGRVLDAATDRALWLDSTSAAPSFRLMLRDLATGADAIVAESPTAMAGALFPGGVLYWDLAPASGVYEWRASTGIVATVGSWSSGQSTLAPKVSGTWAMWGGNPGGNVRRDLAAGVTQALGGDAARDIAIAVNGDAAWTGSAGRYWTYRAGVAEGRTVNGSVGSRIQVDVVNTVFTVVPHDFLTRAYLLQPGGDLLLTQGDNGTFALAGGWIAYTNSLGPVRRRSPSGAIESLGVAAQSGVAVVAITTDGTTLLRTSVNGVARYVRVSPTSAMDDLGAAYSGERVVERSGRFFVIAGGAVSELGR